MVEKPAVATRSTRVIFLYKDLSEQINILRQNAQSMRENDVGLEQQLQQARRLLQQIQYQLQMSEHQRQLMDATLQRTMHGAILEKAVEECEENTFPRIELVHVEVITSATQPLMLAKLQSSRQTTCRVLGASPVPGIKPSGAMVVEKLDNLGEAGLKALFCGRLQEVQPVTWMKSNNPIRTGLLVDEFGTGLPIVLFGEHAVEAWEEGALVSIFHACSQEGLTSPDLTEQSSGSGGFIPVHTC